MLTPARRSVLRKMVVRTAHGTASARGGKPGVSLTLAVRPRPQQLTEVEDGLFGVRLATWTP